MTERARFFVPGPTWVRPEVLQAMSRPVIGHRSAEFREMFVKILHDLKDLFQTKQQAFVATCSGTAMLEGALVNCVSRRVLVTSCGAFSERWLKIAERSGLEADRVDAPWGQAIDPTMLADHIASRRGHYDAVTITYNETSTGVMNNLRELAHIVHRESPGTLVLVDAVSALGSAPLHFDEWGIDVCLASSQKGLALPPGLTVFAVSDRALEVAAKKPYRGMYFDFLEYKKQADAGGAAFTPAISICYALALQLEHILRNETLEKRWERHEAMRALTWEKTSSFARPMTDHESASLSVSALRPLDQDQSDRTPIITAPKIVAAMKERGYTLGGGYGDWKESTFRIGHMGDISLEDLSAMLDVLNDAVSDLQKRNHA